MGYRSDLKVLIYPDVKNPSEEQPLYEQLKVLMATTFKEVFDQFDDPYMTWMHKEYALMFSLEDVKWYPSYPEVRVFEAMLDSFAGGEEGIAGYCTEFIRIGEDTEDVEERHTGHNNHYYLSVRRTIDCNI
jgi:hypothetical protein